jgi:hypothetical protein
VPKGQDILTAMVRERLIALRDAHRLSDAGWARAARQRQQDVSRFVHADMKYPPLDFLESLARVFDHTLADVLAKDAAKSEKPEWQMRVLVALKAMTPTERHAFETLLTRGTPESDTAPRRARR